jgi:hypothetical protein
VERYVNTWWLYFASTIKISDHQHSVTHQHLRHLHHYQFYNNKSCHHYEFYKNNIMSSSSITLTYHHHKVSEWLLFNTKWAIFQLYHGENKYLIRWQWCLLCIGDTMISVLASCAIVYVFKFWSDQTKDWNWYMLLIEHAALRRKSKDWLAWNQDNVSEWSDMSTR